MRQTSRFVNMPAPVWKTKISARKLVARDMLELRLLRPIDFDHLAGQFIQFEISDNGKIAKRAYSIASNPRSPELEFCIKLLPGGLASAYFQQATPESILTFTGPQGRFVCATRGRPMMFVATGAGLGPIMGMITDELKNRGTKEHIELIFGVRSQEDIFWIDRLDALQKEHSNFTYRVTLSQPQGAWPGYSGRVTMHLPESSNGDKQFFLCGSPDMVKETREKLMNRGTDPNDIHFEIF